MNLAFEPEISTPLQLRRCMNQTDSIITESRAIEDLVVVSLVLSGYIEAHGGRRNDPDPGLPPPLQ